MADVGFPTPADSVFSGTWEDGRPKRWPTVQLRVRGRPFDVYCEDPTDVTLDGYGIPVVGGNTVSRADLQRGWVWVERKVPSKSPMSPN